MQHPFYAGTAYSLVLPGWLGQIDCTDIVWTQLNSKNYDLSEYLSTWLKLFDELLHRLTFLVYIGFCFL